VTNVTSAPCPPSLALHRPCLVGFDPLPRRCPRAAAVFESAEWATVRLMGEREPAASLSGAHGEGRADETTLADGEWPVAPQYKVESSAEAPLRDEHAAVAGEPPTHDWGHGPSRVAVLLSVLALLVLLAAVGAWLATGIDGPSSANAPGSAGASREPASTLPPTGTVTTTPPSSSETTTDSTTTSATTQARVSVPDVVGLRAGSAARKLRSTDLRAKTHPVVSSRPAGTVLAQDPAAGIEVDRGDDVELRVAKTPPTVRVSRLVGLTAATAKDRLRDLGLHWTVTEAASQENAGTVLGQSPRAGADVRRGATVTLRISTGPAPVTVPDVSGLEEAAARAELENAGFEVNVVDEPTAEPSEDGKVVAQDPAGGTSVEKGSFVTLTVARLN
jgi:beta-lactam-binding protein with PASTA domain